MYQKGVLGILPTEIIIFVIAVLVLLYAIRVYGTLDTGGAVGRRNATEEEARKHKLHQIANRRLNPSKKDDAE